jgi:hypothetical protein
MQSKTQGKKTSTGKDTDQERGPTRTKDKSSRGASEKASTKKEKSSKR